MQSVPMALTRLVGRGRELAEVERLTSTHRLVTLTGPGGAGKTRLAAEVAARIGESVTWVELASCTQASLVAQQVALALSLRESAGRCALDTLMDSLRGRELLLVLDNCEHVLDATADLVSTLLHRCPRVRILTTSREPLGIAGEQIWPVPPLAIETEAVDLFVDRAKSVDPAFEPAPSRMPAVLEICRRLDGIPLAIELAAARVRVLTPEQIAARLEDRFSLLSGGNRSVARHRTLRATIDWSYALLDSREQETLAKLAVFAGTFSIECVEAVCGPDSLGIVDELVAKSLVGCCSGGTGGRLFLLETIREYAAEKLVLAGIAQETRRRHALAFLDLARAAEPELVSPSAARLDALDADHDNIRAALVWSIEHDPLTTALPLAASFRWYWYYRILWSEGRDWLTRVLAQSGPPVTSAHAALLQSAGTFASYLGDLVDGRQFLEQAESLWRSEGEQRQLAFTLAALTHLLATIGDYEGAASRAEESVSLAMRSGISYDLAYCLTNAAAFAAQARGDLETADLFLEEAESIWRACGNHALGMPFVLNARAFIALRRGDDVAAAHFARSALLETKERHSLWFASRSLRILAYTSARDPLRAARLLGAADGMLRAMTAGMMRHELGQYERLMASLRASLTAEEIEAALSEGNRMSYEQARLLALDTAEPQPFLQIHDLGPLQVTLGGKPLVAEGRSSGRARELLAFLAAHPEGKTKEEVGVAFWPDATTEQVKNSFHVTLHRLRKMLGGPEAIVAEEGRYRIALSHEVDSRRFEKHVASAPESALALYHGDYLQGEDFGDWCLPIRGHLRQLHLRGLFAVGQKLEARGRYDDAADLYTRIITREPFHEPAWRQLMVCRARLGARSESMLLYRQLEQRLRSDLSAVPESETSLLFRKLQQNEAV